MSSHRFEGLEEDIRSLVEDARNKFANQMAAATGERKKALGRELNRSIDRGNQLLQEMENEIKVAPGTYRIQMQSRLRGYRRDLENLSREVNRGLGGGGGLDNVGYNAGSLESQAASNRARLVEGQSSLSRASESIARSHAIAAETDDIGVGILGELGEQREGLERTRDRLVETHGNLGRSRKILNQMARRIIGNKLLLIVIIVVELAILGGVVYWKFFSKKK